MATSRPHHVPPIQTTSHYPQWHSHPSASPYGGMPASTSMSNHATSQAQPSTAGKKRKRLQRACVACHKAKRRCDGGLPCSNCDFSGRTCAYSDAQGKAVPPTKRTLKPSEAALQDQQQAASYGTQPVNHPYGSYSPPALPSMQSRLSQSPSQYEMSPTDPSGFVDPSPDARRELLCVFFSSVQPWNCLLDEISFLRDLSSCAVAPAVLYAIYALSARHISSHSYQTSTMRSRVVQEEVGNGSAYARESRRHLYRDDPRTGLSLIDGDISVETAQALCLLACYEFEGGRYERATAYIHIATKYVSSLRSYGETRSNGYMNQHQGINKRLASMVVVLDLCIGTMSGRGSLLRAWDLEKAFEVLNKFSSHDDLTTDALGQLFCLTLVLSSAIDIHHRAKLHTSQSPAIVDLSDTKRQVRACEAYLQRWADALTPHLRFDEDNLHAVRKALVQNGASTNGPWTATLALLWSAIHMFAETATLLLQDAVDAQLPLAAAENLAMILERMNVQMYRGPIATMGIAMLQSSTSTAEADTRRRLSNSSDHSGLAAVRPWTELQRTADLLGSDAAISVHCLFTAKQYFSLGSSYDASSKWVSSLNRPARPSWTTSPSLANVSAARSSTTQSGSAHTGRAASASISSSNGYSSHQRGHSLTITSQSTESTSPLLHSSSLYTGTVPSLARSGSTSSSSSASGDHPKPSSQQLAPIVSHKRGPLSSSSSPSNTLPPLRFPSPEQQMIDRVSQ